MYIDCEVDARALTLYIISEALIYCQFGFSEEELQMQFILLSGCYEVHPLQHPHHTTKPCYLSRKETKAQPAALQLQLKLTLV